jgi:hypothetical protein
MMVATKSNVVIAVARSSFAGAVEKKLAIEIHRKMISIAVTITTIISQTYPASVRYICHNSQIISLFF